jgi:hypothetical protein
LNHDILLNLDATEVLGKDSQGIFKLMQECNLVDLHDVPEMALEQQLQDTYRRGDKLISCLVHTRYKCVSNDEVLWNTMMA